MLKHLKTNELLVLKNKNDNNNKQLYFWVSEIKLVTNCNYTLIWFRYNFLSSHIKCFIFWEFLYLFFFFTFTFKDCCCNLYCSFCAYNYNLLIFEFFTPALADGLSQDSKSPQVFRTLLSILADLNDGVVWMVFNRPLISKSSTPGTNPLMTVSRAQITIGINVTFTFFFFFFNSLARSKNLFFFSLSFNFTLWSARTAKSTMQQVLFCCWLWLGLLVWPRLGDPYHKIPEEFVCLILQDRFWVAHINFNFLHNSH